MGTLRSNSLPGTIPELHIDLSYDVRLFAESVGGNKGDRLFSALRGRHPYRYFKDTADRLDLLQEYYNFRFAAYCSFAEEWCKENGLKYHHRKKR